MDNPTARSEKGRLSNNFVKLAGNDEAFHSARIARAFPSVTTGEKTKFSAHSENRAVFWDSANCRSKFELSLQKLSSLLTLGERIFFR